MFLSYGSRPPRCSQAVTTCLWTCARRRCVVYMLATRCTLVTKLSTTPWLKSNYSHPKRWTRSVSIFLKIWMSPSQLPSRCPWRETQRPRHAKADIEVPSIRRMHVASWNRRMPVELLNRGIPVESSNRRMPVVSSNARWIVESANASYVATYKDTSTSSIWKVVLLMLISFYVLCSTF